MTAIQLRRSVNLVLVVGAVFCGCDYHDLAKTDRNDSQAKFVTHKKFMKEVSFSGVVVKRTYCEDCNFNKYQLVISLKEKKSEVIAFSNLSYQPYYEFNADNQLVISVTKKLYDAITENSFVEKELNSSSLNVGSKKYKLISDKGSKWLPD